MARKSARLLWADKIKGKHQEKSIEKSDGLKLGRTFQGNVLGIDPSLRSTGLAVIQFKANTSAILLASRTVTLKPKLTMAACLAEISRAVTEMIETYPIDYVAMEQTIYVQNFQTAQILGAARGAAMAAAALKRIPVEEYPPLRIKQAVVGYGRASKEQVAKTVIQLLGLKSKSMIKTSHDADAASVAICHALTFRI